MKENGVNMKSMIDYNVELAIGYLYRKYPSSYSVAYRILSELNKRIYDF